jgi:hypothetical protein
LRAALTTTTAPPFFCFCCASQDADAAKATAALCNSLSEPGPSRAGELEPAAGGAGAGDALSKADAVTAADPPPSPSPSPLRDPAPAPLRPPSEFPPTHQDTKATEGATHFFGPPTPGFASGSSSSSSSGRGGSARRRSRSSSPGSWAGPRRRGSRELNATDFRHARVPFGHNRLALSRMALTERAQSVSEAHARATQKLPWLPVLPAADAVLVECAICRHLALDDDDDPFTSVALTLEQVRCPRRGVWRVCFLPGILGNCNTPAPLRLPPSRSHKTNNPMAERGGAGRR